MEFGEAAEPIGGNRGDGGSRFNEFGECPENLRAFRGTTHHNEGTFVHRDLLLHPTGVRDQECRFCSEGKKVAVADRFDDGQPIERPAQVELRDPANRSGVERYKHGDRKVRQPREDAPKALGIVDVLGSVEGGEHEFTRLDAVPVDDRGSLVFGWQQPIDRFDDRVPRDDDAIIVDPLGEKIASIRIGRRKTSIRKVVGDDAIVLFGHPAIEAPETRFDVDEGDLCGVGGQSTCGDRVRITLDDDGERPVFCKQSVETFGSATDLGPAPLCPNTDVDVRLRHAELVEEDTGELRVIVLPRVDHPSGGTEETHEAREFDDLGTRPEDDGDGSVGEYGHAESCLVRVRGTLRVVMVRLLASIPQAMIAALAGYNAIVALWGWKNRRPAAPSEPRRIRVVIPAHNEAGVVGNLVADLHTQTHPMDMYEIVVVADRCTDGTAAAAEPARVLERREGGDGKGAAIAWYLDREPLDPEEVLLVVDADNRVPPVLLERISAEVAAGHAVVQCFLDVANPDESPVALASALSYWAGNRMVQLARSNLGWSADLGGTGMAFTRDALEEVGGFGDGLTEDQELGVRLALAGRTVEWIHDVRIYDEKPAAAASAVQQRARWMAGRRAVARRYLGPLWRGAIEQRSLRLFDVGLRLVQPGRSFVAALSGGLTLTALATRSRLLFPWPIWGAITALQFLEPIPFLHRDGVATKHLLRYPFLAILAVLWIPIRIVSAMTRGWGHTVHTGGATNRESGGPDPAPGAIPTGDRARTTRA